jgi:hypothetical protein
VMNKFCDRGGHETNPVLVVLDLFGNADAHGSSHGFS